MQHLYLSFPSHLTLVKFTKPKRTKKCVQERKKERDNERKNSPPRRRHTSNSLSLLPSLFLALVHIHNIYIYVYMYVYSYIYLCMYIGHYWI